MGGATDSDAGASSSAPAVQHPRHDAPPAYASSALSPETIGELNAAFSSLDLASISTTVTQETCLAHLKLLNTFQNLKEDVGYTDGLWQIYDSRVLSPNVRVDGNEGEKPEPERLLAMLREKRWALYLARAVDRYEAWWDIFPADPLREQDLAENSPKFAGFVECDSPQQLHFLPPIDVLMVWHAHMLNPRDYLEDCMRTGLKDLWNAGMPWNLVNEAIDTSFNYKPSDDSIEAWESLTGRRWNNVDDSITKALKCPSCNTVHEIPWTTCGMAEDSKSPDLDLKGEGYGDGLFAYTCHSCGTRMTREYLELAKFVKDTQLLLAQSQPMPGTFLDYKNGKPDPNLVNAMRAIDDQTFANRLIKMHLRSKVLELTKAHVIISRLDTPSLEDVRQMIEDAMKNQRVLRAVEDRSARQKFNVHLNSRSRVTVRKMMSRYWGNFTPFALELGGAVLRQGIFSEKMQKIDWLHSPAAKETIARLITKYHRFIDILAKNPGHVAVPTLDVDLAWHTHQLSPRAYYDYTNEKTDKLVDHDDKINETKLTTSFEWTSKVYQETFNEVYSECTCWYCESIRASHVSSVGRLFGLSNNEKIVEGFHKSGAAKLCPPDQSAHISSHNAVRFHDADPRKAKILQRIHDAQLLRLEEGYKKAQKRAQKKGRDIPPRDQYYYAWGYPYLMYGPFIVPVYYTPGMYYGGADPCQVSTGSGHTGACAGDRQLRNG
ncbi:hypothetical protein PG996_008670 [Apiospora saccharicola]|uniref:Alpha-ketoglutarate-dependent sulfonate dioxygenase n=1 Tax=Apiospora saccharicola TaxID=335842 RepID=A0ABR1UYL2_9PEZI